MMEHLRELRERADALQLRAGVAGGSADGWLEALNSLSAAIEELEAREAELRAKQEGVREAELLLEQERARHRLGFQRAPEPYLVTDADGVIREANEAAGRLLRTSPQRLRGKPLPAFIPVERRRDFAAELLRRTIADGSADLATVLLTPGGAEVPVECAVAVVESGTALGPSLLHWILRPADSPEGLQAQSRALKREHRARVAAETEVLELDALIRHLPVGVLVAEAPSGRMLTYNQAVEGMLGFPPPLADSVEEYSVAYRGFHPDGRPYDPEEWPLARAVREGKLVRGEEVEMERPDATRRVFRLSAAPVRDAEGTVVAAVATLQDVTEAHRRQSAERLLGEVSDALTASLEDRGTLQTVAELCARTISDCCVIHIEEGDGIIALRIADASQSSADALCDILRGFPPDTLPDHPVGRALSTGEPQWVSELTDEEMGRIAPAEEQREVLRQLRVASVLVVPLRAGGRSLGALSLARTDLRAPFDAGDIELAGELAARVAHAVDNARLYREAQNAARARDEILGVVSHDLRNSLNAALMNTELLLDVTPAFEDGSRERRQMQSVRRALHHMHRLVQDLLEVDRLERGRISIESRPIAGEMLAEEIRHVFGALTADAGLELELRIPGTLPPILADHARLMQVLGNLVGNAVQHTPQGGKIVVSAERSDGQVRMAVADTGTGIPEADLPRIFDRFYQAGEGGGAGSGLGLTIARGIVEAHGGRMWAESRVGEGSTFFFTLPKAE